MREERGPRETCRKVGEPLGDVAVVTGAGWVAPLPICACVSSPKQRRLPVRDTKQVWRSPPPSASTLTGRAATGPRAVVLSSARASGGSLDVAELPAVSLGRSIDPAGPALLALEDAVLVGFVDEADGAVVVERVRVTDAATGAMTHDEVHREVISGTAERGDVSLALGASAGGRARVALAWRQGGCGAAGRAAMRLLDVSAAGVAPTGPAIELTGEAGRPALAWQPALSQWVVVARRRDDLLAAVVEADPSVHGELALALAAPGGRAHYAAAGSDAAFVALGWASGVGAGAFGAARVACLAPP